MTKPEPKKPGDTRPENDVGGLEMAGWLEGVGPLRMGLARHGVGNFNFSLGVNLPG
jgi:8-hydroxy-5-deazaflavin:NADPH oxidoreductase